MLVSVNKFGGLVMFGSFRKAWLLPVQQRQVAQLKIGPDAMQAREAGRSTQQRAGSDSQNNICFWISIYWKFQHLSVPDAGLVLKYRRLKVYAY